MNKEITTSMTPAELRAVIKSLSIGCDQLAKKFERLSGTAYENEVAVELTLLLSVHGKLNTAMKQALSDTQML